MAKSEKLEHIHRRLTDEERRLAVTIREGAEQDFPPKSAAQGASASGIPSQIEAARKRRGMTRYELAQTANVASTVVRAIEQGEDVPLSQFRAVAAALGLNIELVEQVQ